MIEAVLGIHARRSEPVAARLEPPQRIAADAHGDGVSLRKLLTVATLTPAQAALLVADVVDQLELARSEGRYPIDPWGDAVTVSESGQLTIECTGSASSWPPVRDAMASLLGCIASNCRDSTLANRLSESIAETTNLAGLTQRIRQAVGPELDPTEEARRRCQLAGLVSATKGRPLPDGRAVAEPANGQTPPCLATGSSLAPTGWYPPVRNAWHRPRRRPSWRRGMLGLTAILILVGALWTGPRAWSELSRGWDALLHPVNPSEQNHISPVSPPPPAPEADQANSPTAQGTAEAGPVHTGLPGSAGPITLVTATFANGVCATGQPCTMRVDVHVDPAANVGAVTWRTSVYDRCSGAVHPGNDVTMPVPPGVQQVYGITRVVLPPAPSLAVAALTSAPAAAASEPAFVPAENATC